MNRAACACLLLAAGGTTAQAQLTTEVFVTGIDRPVYMTHAGDGSGRTFIIEQEGAIRIVDADGNLLPTPFMDIDGTVQGGDSGGNEQGLLGLAFHPDYANNGKFYVNYTGSGGDTRIAEYQVSSSDPNVADTGTARIIMFYDQPFSNHNGGWLGFGPDGYLYISAGDGGSANDPGNRAGNLSNYLGKLHRVDVDGGDDFPADPNQNYEIPADNPFVGTAGALESIWAYGLRNPWRTSFDRETGDLWIADVGQNVREEVNFAPAGDAGGQHYGWRCREGFSSTGLSCGATSGFTDPIHQYTHGANGCSITGGYAYRGCELGDDYTGLYFFSDYCSGLIWTLDASNGFAHTLQFDSNFNVSSFGETESGELLVANLFAGTVYKIVNPSNPDSNGDGIPDSCDSACLPDLNEDGNLDFFDISAFLNAFNAQEPLADFTGDGNYDFFDVSAFLNAFNAGCP
ncbi:MAG: glucose dehydrogenase [Phycisphaerae bacterium]|nr:glucose dehydrogenase [Phycisphaerae bacterium]MBM90551.1 glucose dehydrogenase [Phycisphaerae bacterium]